jgi:hypothetical protein
MHVIENRGGVLLVPPTASATFYGSYFKVWLHAGSGARSRTNDLVKAGYQSLVYGACCCSRFVCSLDF